jgi:hypothetical protein
VDPKFFAALTKLQDIASAKHSSLAVWKSVDPLLLEEHELLFNQLSGRHSNSQDLQLAYVGLYAARNFKSGSYLYFHQFNL